jgi:energy-coupling factor transporter ATP-binding protein EcfA2
MFGPKWSLMVGDADLGRDIRHRIFPRKLAAITLAFAVTPDTNPPSNIHVLIGRNGVGKTTLLHAMARVLIDNDEEDGYTGRFYFESSQSGLSPDTATPFAGVVSVSFSAFDRLPPLADAGDATNNLRYTYVGLKTRDASADNEWRLKKRSELCEEFR